MTSDYWLDMSPTTTAHGSILSITPGPEDHLTIDVKYSSGVEHVLADLAPEEAGKLALDIFDILFDGRYSKGELKALVKGLYDKSEAAKMESKLNEQAMKYFQCGYSTLDPASRRVIRDLTDTQNKLIEAPQSQTSTISQARPNY